MKILYDIKFYMNKKPSWLDDAPSNQLVSERVGVVSLCSSTLFCTLCVSVFHLIQLLQFSLCLSRNHVTCICVAWQGRVIIIIIIMLEEVSIIPIIIPDY
jgi:hypothetical protein